MLGLRGGKAFKCVYANDVLEGCGYGPKCRLCTIRSTVLNTLSTHENACNVEADMEFTDKGKRVLTINTVFLEEDSMVIVALNDITELKNLENILLEKERLEAAITTSGGICHEINQPLTVINGYIDLSLQNLDESNQIFEYLSQTQIEMKRVKDIMQRLMSLNSFRTVPYLSENSRILDITKSSEKIGSFS
jgi:nitrogen-specific signal transduction histidine kinase